MLVAAFAQEAHADIYHRFWRGMKRPELSSQQFVADLNQIFISATVKTGAGKGLIAYQPVVTARWHGLPDEIALVSYDDKAAYDALYLTEPGKHYQALHGQYFDMANSHSLVPQPFVGNIEMEHAYDLHPSYSEWKRYATSVLVFFRRTGEADAAYLMRANQHLRQATANDTKSEILDRVALISQEYWIEYVSHSGHAIQFTADAVFHLASETPGAAKILPGRGVNLRF